MKRIGLLLFVFLLGVLVAQQKAEPPLHVVTYVDVYPNFADATAKLLQQFAADNRKDAGFVRFEALRDVARVNHFAIVEVWQSKQAYEAHLTAPHTKAFRDQLQMGLGSPFDERLYNALP
ncbi:MAG: antibiotic biosynthesis monooxygenase [Acidobacteriia bacterium]|nr:antibiotic biosynthesis monooxygenase [Terriglobia bacterium]